MNKICLGAIVGVHGIKGEVKIKSFTQIDADIDQYGPLEDKSGRKFTIKVVGRSKELLRAKIKGVDDRNISEGLIGTELFIDRDILPELEEEEFYHNDLIGLDTKDQNGELVGKVAGVFNFGAGDLIEIKLTDTKKSEMLPFTEAYIPEINIKNGYIIISQIALDFFKTEEKDEG